MDTLEKYFSIGIDRAILGTSAVTDETFLQSAVDRYGEKIAVGVDVKDGLVAIKGWTETADFTFFDFCKKMERMGVRTLICTDISRDGAMKGTNRSLYKELSEFCNIQIVASGGVSDIEDVRALRNLSLYGAIIGKAYYTKAINLREAIEVAK